MSFYLNSTFQQEIKKNKFKITELLDYEMKNNVESAFCMYLRKQRQETINFFERLYNATEKY